MTIRPPLDVQAASRLASKMRLRDVVCTEIRAKHMAVSSESGDAVLSWDLKHPHASWRSENGEVAVLFPFAITIDAKKEGGSRATPVAEIALIYQLLYAVDQLEPMEVAELPHFLGVSGFMHLWPYVRAEVQCITAKLRLPPLVLPVVVSGHAAEVVTVSPLGKTVEDHRRRLSATKKKAKRSASR